MRVPCTPLIPVRKEAQQPWLTNLRASPAAPSNTIPIFVKASSSPSALNKIGRRGNAADIKAMTVLPSQEEEAIQHPAVQLLAQQLGYYELWKHSQHAAAYTMVWYTYTRGNCCTHTHRCHLYCPAQLLSNEYNHLILVQPGEEEPRGSWQERLP